MEGARGNPRGTNALKRGRRGSGADEGEREFVALVIMMFLLSVAWFFF
jgi:hypothetical protein